MALIRFIMAAGLAVFATAQAATQPSPATMGRSLATLEHVPLRSSEGARFRLGSRLQPGKPTLIAFWASWCMPCIAEAPGLANLRREYGGQYTFLSINRQDGDPDPRQPASAVADFLTRAGMTKADYVIADVPAYRRIVGADGAAIPENAVGIPRIYLFDRYGRQVYTAMGFTEARGAELERQLRKAVTAQ